MRNCLSFKEAVRSYSKYGDAVEVHVSEALWEDAFILWFTLGKTTRTVKVSYKEVDQHCKNPWTVQDYITTLVDQFRKDIRKNLDTQEWRP